MSEFTNKAFSIVENKATNQFEVVKVSFNTEGDGFSPNVEFNVLGSFYSKSEAVERFKITVADNLL